VEVNAWQLFSLPAPTVSLAPTLKRFLFVSSQAAAGPGQSPAPLQEIDPARPISAYGESKRQAEEMVLAAAAHLPVTIVRPAAVYGARERDLSNTFPLIENRIHPVLGLQEKFLVMVYVEDLVQGMIAAAESAQALGNVYFLNHLEVLTARQVPRTIAAAMDKPAGLPLPVPLILPRLAAPFAEWGYRLTRQRPPLTRDKAKEVAQRYWVADPGRARADFGWEARHSLAEGMVPTVAAYRQEQAALREMPLEKPKTLWAKYVISATALGLLIEILSATGNFYTFQPAWAVLVAVAGFFGALLGTLAMWTRRRPAWLQFLAGTAPTVAVELANEYGWLPLISWRFSPGWPPGISDPLLRAFVLGAAGGVVILLANAMVRALYRRRLRVG
jgi:nucleoside-diphosphate-sugar epimerase